MFGNLFRSDGHHYPDTASRVLPTGGSVITLIELTDEERDVAREVIQNIHAVAKVEHLKRLGLYGKEGAWGGQWEAPNSAQMIDEIVHAINLARIKQAEHSSTQDSYHFGPHT